MVSLPHVGIILNKFMFNDNFYVFLCNLQKKNTHEFKFEKHASDGLHLSSASNAN